MNSIIKEENGKIKIDYEKLNKLNKTEYNNFIENLASNIDKDRFFKVVNEFLKEQKTSRIIILNSFTIIIIKLLKTIFFINFFDKPFSRKPPLKSLTNFADYFALPTRKAIKAMAGDYDEEITRLRREKRLATARWNVILAWGYAIWIIARSPIDKAFRYAMKLFSAN